MTKAYLNNILEWEVNLKVSLHSDSQNIYFIKELKKKTELVIYIKIQRE